MKILETIENTDGSVTLQLDLTPEEHHAILEAAIVRAMILGIEETKSLVQPYYEESTK